MQSRNTGNRGRKLLTGGVAALGLFMAVPGMAMAGDHRDYRRDHRYEHRHHDRCEHRSHWRSSHYRKDDRHDRDYRDSRYRRDRRDDRVGFGLIVSEGRRGSTVGIVINSRR